jgi:hypothetical protein
LGHLFGYFHNNRFLDELGWDVTGRLIDNPATNNVTTQVKELDRRDIMVPGLLSEQAWVDTSTYSAMLSDHTVQCAPPDFHNFVAIIQGIFDPWDPYLSELNPVFRYPWPSSPTPKRFQQGPFTLRLVDETGREYVQNFDATTFTEDPEGPETQFGAFQVGVPVDPNARIVLMQIYDGQRLLASMQGSKEPTIEILSPQPGDSLGEMTTIAVQIEDSDTDPSLMMINAAYSPDDGESWVPIAVQLPGTTTEFEVNTTEIQRSDGQGVIRVFVSDGLNTAYADAVDLTPKQAIYAVPEPGLRAGLILCASVLSILGRRPRR